MIRPAEQGASFHATFITSHSVSDMRGIFFILRRSRLHLQSSLDYMRNRISQKKYCYIFCVTHGKIGGTGAVPFTL